MPSSKRKAAHPEVLAAFRNLMEDVVPALQKHKMMARKLGIPVVEIPERKTITTKYGQVKKAKWAPVEGWIPVPNCKCRNCTYLADGAAVQQVAEPAVSVG